MPMPPETTPRTNAIHHVLMGDKTPNVNFGYSLRSSMYCHFATIHLYFSTGGPILFSCDRVYDDAGSCSVASPWFDEDPTIFSNVRHFRIPSIRDGL